MICQAEITFVKWKGQRLEARILSALVVAHPWFYGRSNLIVSKPDQGPLQVGCGEVTEAKQRTVNDVLASILAVLFQSTHL